MFRINYVKPYISSHICKQALLGMFKPNSPLHMQNEMAQNQSSDLNDLKQFEGVPGQRPSTPGPLVNVITS